jgi:hypothetical protein
MHVIEHIGLGRYGDEPNYDGDIIGFNELKRVLARGGNLLIVVPVGKPKLVYNAHRIYSFEQILEIYGDLNLIEFALIPDGLPDSYIVNPKIEEINSQEYGCGCFWFKKE